MDCENVVMNKWDCHIRPTGSGTKQWQYPRDLTTGVHEQPQNGCLPAYTNKWGNILVYCIIKFVHSIPGGTPFLVIEISSHKQVTAAPTHVNTLEVNP